MRIFVALFDYDPPTMSPNPDACDEELPFREGQLIKVSHASRVSRVTCHVCHVYHVCHVSCVQVYGEKDADGFYWGEAGPRQGFVPCNMVSEVQVGGGSVTNNVTA